jgi:hypothetical protein
MSTEEGILLTMVGLLCLVGFLVVTAICMERDILHIRRILEGSHSKESLSPTRLGDSIDKVNNETGGKHDSKGL